VLFVVTLAAVLPGCSAAPEVTRFQARPAAPTVPIEPGEHPLRLSRQRDGLLYVPKSVASRTSVPLFVMLHGGGDRADGMRFMFPPAEELGVVVVVPDARDNTWDGIEGRIGPDVVFIDAALRHTFERVAVDPQRIAIGGASDGASYALSLGLANGDLFTHLIAFAPGSIFTPPPPVGRPLIFVAHGTRDRVLPIDLTSRRMVPWLRNAGYRVTYREFDGVHAVPKPIAREALEWLTQ
jgi:predicted esterase